ncbi:MAG: hypothetical protein ACRC92_20160 [Peptostreptococcaceae bacterium]
MIKVRFNTDTYIMNKMDLLKSSYITSDTLIRLHYVSDVQSYDDKVDMLCTQQLEFNNLVYDIDSAMIHNKSLYINCTKCDRDESKTLNTIEIDNNINDNTSFSNIHLIYQDGKYKLKIELIKFEEITDTTVDDILSYVNLPSINIDKTFSLNDNTLLIG